MSPPPPQQGYYGPPNNQHHNRSHHNGNHDTRRTQPAQVLRLSVPSPAYSHPQFRPQQPSVAAHAPPTPLHQRGWYVVNMVSIARPFVLIIPGVIVILNVWWSSTQHVCPRDATANHHCFWMLWSTLPLSTATFIWAIMSNISARRAIHRMSHIPRLAHAAIQLLLALGSSVCFALLVYHAVHFDIWSETSEGAMAALVAILMYVAVFVHAKHDLPLTLHPRLANWVLFGWTAYEIRRDQHIQRFSVSQIPM